MNRLRALLRSLTPADRARLRRAADLIGTVLVTLLSRRLLAAGVAVAGVSIAGTLALTGPSGSPPAGAPIKQAWLDHAGPYKVERVNVPCLSADVSLTIPAKGVGHTTEGSWDSAMSVFRRHYAPTFMVGRDGNRVRIVQFCPLGKIASALRNTAGGVETNRWARAQIELVARSSRASWQPDTDVMRAYAALLYELRDVAGIPLRHITNQSRDPRVWRDSAGWFDHAGVPENSHWDMGAFRWPAALTAAGNLAPVVNPGHELAQAPPAPARRYVVCALKAPLKRPLCVRTANPGGLVASRLEHGWRKVTADRAA